MKSVLDTNALVSGLKTPGGTCAQILFLALDGYVTLCVDHRILDEYRRVCRDPALRLDPVPVRTVLDFLEESSERVTGLPVSVTLPDPSDAPFLEVASAAGACLVTGNIRHFPTIARRDVEVVTPRELLDLLGRHAGRA